jgi:hypothetical protein
LDDLTAENVATAKISVPSAVARLAIVLHSATVIGDAFAGHALMLAASSRPGIRQPAPADRPDPGGPAREPDSAWPAPGMAK